MNTAACPFSRSVRPEFASPALPLAPHSADLAARQAARGFLAGIQGGIVSERGRGECGAVLGFVFAAPDYFAANAATLRATAELVTTALAQAERVAAADATAERDGDGDRPAGCPRHRTAATSRDTPFLSLALTGAGLRACGLAPSAAGEREPENFFPPDGLGEFDDGQRAEAVGVLHDDGDAAGAPRTWEPAYATRLHGLWLVGHDSPAELAAAVASLRAWGEARGLRFALVERGGVRRDARGTVREPFGFADGIAVPRFLADDGATSASARVPLDELFLQDGVHAGGTFLVFRKLEQRVRAFRAAHAATSSAAQLVGRDANGVPLIAARTCANSPADRCGAPSAPCDTPAAADGREAAAASEAFDFRADPRGAVCPFHAHIRRANPRGVQDLAAGEVPSRLPLVRRPWVYGEPAALADPRGAEGGVGLLFLAYMKTLEHFRTMQGDWLYRRGFPVAAAQRPDGLLFGGFADATGAHRRWVEPRGGEYFYVPSLRWLRSVAPARDA